MSAANPWNDPFSVLRPGSSAANPWNDPFSMLWNDPFSVLRPSSSAANPWNDPFSVLRPSSSAANPWNDTVSVLRPSSSAIERSILAVETILDYSFRDKTLLEAALTHPSCTGSRSYQTLERLGDDALGLMLSTVILLVYPDIKQGQLSFLREANLTTEKLARVAIRRGFYQHVIRKNTTALDAEVEEFDAIVRQEDGNAVAYGGSVKAPKVLADIVESIAAAIYIDVKCDLRKLWMIFRRLLEPIVKLQDMPRYLHPVSMLYGLYKKERVSINNWKIGTENIASVHVDGVFVASSSSKWKEVAKRSAAKLALIKLSKSLSAKTVVLESLEIEGAKEKLHELCCKKKWLNPSYRIEKEGDPPHEKKYVCSVKVRTADGVLCMTGDEKSRVNDAENSAASFLIRASQEFN